MLTGQRINAGVITPCRQRPNFLNQGYNVEDADLRTETKGNFGGVNGKDSQNWTFIRNTSWDSCRTF
jgi:hypothetical protein